MYPNIIPDSLGVMVRDQDRKLVQEIRDALKAKKRLFLIAKPKKKECQCQK